MRLYWGNRVSYGKRIKLYHAGKSVMHPTSGVRNGSAVGFQGQTNFLRSWLTHTSIKSFRAMRDVASRFFRPLVSRDSDKMTWRLPTYPLAHVLGLLSTFRLHVYWFLGRSSTLVDRPLLWPLVPPTLLFPCPSLCLEVPCLPGSPFSVLGPRLLAYVFQNTEYLPSPHLGSITLGREHSSTCSTVWGGGSRGQSLKGLALMV